MLQIYVQNVTLHVITDNHPGDSSDLGQLGRVIGSSERPLSRLFRQGLGMSFRQWRTLLRIQHSLIHLADGMSVIDTATDLG